MNFSFDELVRFFWKDFHHASSKESYINLLVSSKLNCMEMLETLEGEEFLTFYDNSPLLAMISEVHRVCPEAVNELAKRDNFFSTALGLFENYSDEKRDLLRDTFLKRPNTLFRFK